jgi:hypothetical protein
LIEMVQYFDETRRHLFVCLTPATLHLSCRLSLKESLRGFLK